MSTHHNRKLFDLATKNSQRRALERLSGEASPAFRRFLDDHEKVFHPETPIELKEAVSLSARLHVQTELPEGAQILETASFENAIKWFLGHVPLLTLGEYFVWVGPGGGVAFDGEPEWVPELPIISAAVDSIMPVLSECLVASAGQLAIVKCDESAAIVMDSYGGFLLNEPSDREVVYQLSHWKQNG